MKVPSFVPARLRRGGVGKKYNPRGGGISVVSVQPAASNFLTGKTLQTKKFALALLCYS
jgi:hypothetical protein